MPKSCCSKPKKPARAKSVKRANESSASPVSRVAFQPWMPVQDRRKLTPEEERAIEEGENRWLPAIFQNYGTPVPHLMSSPAKGAILAGLLGALGTGGLWSLLRPEILDSAAEQKLSSSGLSPAVLSALISLLGGSGAAAWTYFSRQAHNAGLRDMMQRLPENPTLRDLMSDPVYMRNRMQMAGADPWNRRPGPYFSPPFRAHRPWENPGISSAATVNDLLKRWYS